MQYQWRNQNYYEVNDMKQNWTYKKLGEVCTINYGTRVVQEKDKGSTYYVYGGGGATFMVDSYNREDCFIVSRFAMSPKCTRFVKGKFFLNDSGLSVSTKIKELSQPFLDKVILANNDTIYSMGKGMAQRNLDIPSFRNMSIPVPPLSIQSRIVSELDLLQSIIDKQKAQLKEYDTLAQSIFYDMFGDPVENEKGWEVKKLGEVGHIARGVSKHRPRNAPELLGNYMPFIQTGDIANSGMYITDCQSGYSELGVAQSKIWHKGTLCITIAANIGKCAIMTFDACFPDSVVGFIAMSNISLVEYVYYFFLCVQKDMEENAMGVAQKNINLAILNSMNIPVPPLSLQQSFAAKIESIEKQKSAISKSIAETEKLFDYTMDKYFG